MGTAITHPVLDQVKPSFVIFDVRALSVRVPRYQKLHDGLTWSGMYRMLYSCAHMTTVGVRGLSCSSCRAIVSSLSQQSAIDEERVYCWSVEDALNVDAWKGQRFIVLKLLHRILQTFDVLDVGLQDRWTTYRQLIDLVVKPYKQWLPMKMLIFIAGDAWKGVVTVSFNGYRGTSAFVTLQAYTFQCTKLTVSSVQCSECTISGRQLLVSQNVPFFCQR